MVEQASTSASGSAESPNARKVAAENRMGVAPEGRLAELAYLLQRGITDTLAAPSSSSTDSRSYAASGDSHAAATFHTHSPEQFAKVRRARGSPNYADTRADGSLPQPTRAREAFTLAPCPPAAGAQRAPHPGGRVRREPGAAV